METSITFSLVEEKKMMLTTLLVGFILMDIYHNRTYKEYKRKSEKNMTNKKATLTETIIMH